MLLKTEMLTLNEVGKQVVYKCSSSSCLWVVSLFQAVITECIVMIRKSVLQLECHRKVAYVMTTLQENAVSHSFPVLEADPSMWDFFEGYKTHK